MFGQLTAVERYGLYEKLEPATKRGVDVVNLCELLACYFEHFNNVNTVYTMPLNYLDTHFFFFGKTINKTDWGRWGSFVCVCGGVREEEKCEIQ